MRPNGCFGETKGMGRIEEILIDIKKKLRESKKENFIQSDIVLTGGTAKLKNIQCVAEDALEQTVRIGIPKIDDADRGFNDVLSSPTFATAVGIIRHFSGRRQMEITLAKIADIFRNFFE